MYEHELFEAVSSIINENDLYKVSKLLQLKSWCNAFMELFSLHDRECLPFFLDVLSHKECWEKTDTIHGIRLNRRIAAKKMVEPVSWRYTINPLSTLQRYRVACWCCLEEEIFALYKHYKQNEEINTIVQLQKFAKTVSLDVESRCPFLDIAFFYWTNVTKAGSEIELKTERKELYEYGLFNYALYKCRVEGVEFFWNKIQSLPEYELSTQQKHEIFMKAIILAAGSHCEKYPEIFVFFLSQIGPNRYQEILKRNLAQNHSYSILTILQNAFCFDQFQRVFDCLAPCEIPEMYYYNLLKWLEEKDCPGYYDHKNIWVFTYMWLKKGFDRHRDFVLREELTGYFHPYRRYLVISLTLRNYMPTVWEILDKASPDQIKEFITSEQAFNVYTILRERGYYDSLHKLLSYHGS